MKTIKLTHILFSLAVIAALVLATVPMAPARSSAAVRVVSAMGSSGCTDPAKSCLLPPMG